MKNGIGSYYFWKKDTESFGKIINMISQNGEIIRNILKRKYAIKKIHSKPSRLRETRLHQKIRDESTPFDVTEFWYNTEYTKSFIKNSTLEHFVSKAYQKCILDPVFLEYFKSRGMKPTKNVFNLILFENHDSQILLTFMMYSPSLILYIVNLDTTYKERIATMDERKDLIFQTVLQDKLAGNRSSHGGGFFSIPSIEKRFGKNGTFEGVDATISMSFYSKGKGPLSLGVKRKIKPEDEI